eukprot:10268407-Alexandrium_andersonii.AAC.1
MHGGAPTRLERFGARTGNRNRDRNRAGRWGRGRAAQALFFAEVALDSSRSSGVEKLGAEQALG